MAGCDVRWWSSTTFLLRALNAHLLQKYHWFRVFDAEVGADDDDGEVVAVFEDDAAMVGDDFFSAGVEGREDSASETDIGSRIVFTRAF